MNYIIKSYGLELNDMDEKGTVLFYASQFDNVDADGDIIRRGAFTKTLKENKERIRYLNQHRTDQQLGVILDAREDDAGLLVKSAINLNKEMGRDVYEDYRMALKYSRSVEHSIGFYTIKERGDDPREILEAKLMEASYVTWGSNPNTPLLSVKGEDICFLGKCLSEGNYTDKRIDQLHALKVKAEQSLLQEESAANDDLVTFFNLLNL